MQVSDQYDKGNILVAVATNNCCPKTYRHSENWPYQEKWWEVKKDNPDQQNEGDVYSSGPSTWNKNSCD